MTDDRATPADDAPVTWGELREVVKLSIQYQSSLLLWSIQGVTAGLARDESREERQNAAAKTEARTREIAMELLKKVPGVLDE